MEEKIPITPVTPVDSRLWRSRAWRHFCPLKYISPLHKKNAEAALMRLHRGCEGYDNGLVNYLCVLFFPFFGRAGRLVRVGGSEWQEGICWSDCPPPTTGKSKPIESH